jgi:hypothetical protein
MSTSGPGAPKIPAMGTASATIAPSRPRRTRRSPDAPPRDKVLAVVIERGDKTCAVVCPGSGESWPSLRAAKQAVELLEPMVWWRETTRGVWVGVTGPTF